METKLYITDEALEKYGYAYFKDCDIDDYKSFAVSEPTELEDGLLVTRDDMYNITLSANEDDERETDIESLRNKIELCYFAQYFNMRAICDKASVSYDTYKNIARGRNVSDTVIIKLLVAMKEIANDINIVEEE